MMSGNLGPILNQYRLSPTRVESYGKLKKVYTDKGIYALKETNMSVDERASFVHVLERFHHLGFDRYAAPYATKQREPIIVHGEKTYYLMPWLNEEEFGILSKEERLIETGAILHTLTEKEQLYDNDVIEHSFHSLNDRWMNRISRIETFAKKAEEQIYFSPFELSFLSHFSSAMKGSEKAGYRLKKWFDKAKEEKRYRVVLCHGKFTVHHLINGDLVNFEKSVLDSPVRDLAMMYRSSLMNDYSDRDEPIDWLKTYEEKFPLRKEEKMLLASYLSFPEPICQSVREYINQIRREEELVQVEKLEHRVVGMRNCQQLADQIMDAL